MSKLITIKNNQTSGSTTTTSGTTLNIYTFIDEFGNVTQTKKESKNRLKYYIDPEIIENYCVIGISDENSGPCSEGMALGIADETLVNANYNNKRNLL